MFYKELLKFNESSAPKASTEDAEDSILGITDEKSPEFIDDVAKQVNVALATEAFNAAMFFDGGKEAVNSYLEESKANSTSLASTQSYMEGVVSAVAKNNTIMQLNTRDDMKRRVRLACLIIAKQKKDPLFKKVSIYRMKERAAKKAIYTKYMNLGYKAARLSMSKHEAEKQKASAPKFVKDRTGNKITKASVTDTSVIR